MSSVANNLSIVEKISLVVSVLTLVISFVALALSDSVSSISNKADIVAAKDSINLSPLIKYDGYIDTLRLKNRGRSASKDFKLIIEFADNIPKYELISDEYVGNPEVKGLRLNIPLPRLSSNSDLKITMFSELPISYEASYIDDSGNHEVTIEREVTQLNLLDMILITLVIVSLLAIVWIYRRASEGALIKALDNHQNEIRIKLREVRDEIGNIEIIVNEPIDKGYGQKISEFISKIPSR